MTSADRRAVKRQRSYRGAGTARANSHHGAPWPSAGGIEIIVGRASSTRPNREALGDGIVGVARRRLQNLGCFICGCRLCNINDNRENRRLGR